MQRRGYSVKKHRIALIFLLLFSLVGCNNELKKIKDQFFNEDTLEDYNLVGLPIYGQVNCVVQGNHFYSNSNFELYEKWSLDVVNYFETREDITYWGRMEEYQTIVPNPLAVLKYDNKKDYFKEDSIKMLFTTMELTEEKKFQNCYYIHAYRCDPKGTITVNNEEFSYRFIVKLEKYHVKANRFFAKDYIE